MAAPETALDLEVLLHDRLQIDLEKYMEFTEDDGQLIIKLTKFIDKQKWGVIHGLVREWNGKYDANNRQWLIPKPPQQTKQEVEEESRELGFHKASEELTKPYEDMQERIATKLDEEDPKKQSKSPFEIVPINALVESPFQFRSSYDERKLKELKHSVEQFGVLQPIVVRENGVGALEIVAGHRRFKAASKADLKQVPIIKQKLTDEQAIFAQLAENIQREDASDYDTGKALRKLNMKGWSQQQLADKIGISQNHVSRFIGHYRFCQDTFKPIGLNVNRLKESQTRPLRELDKIDRIKEILSEIRPKSADSELVKAIWTHLHIPTGEYKQAIQAFLRKQDFMTSLLQYEERGPFGDARFPGTIPGFLLVQLIRRFKPSLVFDPMDGGKTTKHVCKAMEVAYQGNDLLDENGYDLVSVPADKLPENDLTFFHPPYWDLIKYSSDPRDLSNINSWEEFCDKLSICIDKLLKKTKRLALLIGDVVKENEFFTPLTVILQQKTKLERILIREYETVTGIHGFYDAIHKGRIPQRHDYLILLKGESQHD